MKYQIRKAWFIEFFGQIVRTRKDQINGSIDHGDGSGLGWGGLVGVLGLGRVGGGVMGLGGWWWRHKQIEKI